jgi:hypothetical protein
MHGAKLTQAVLLTVAFVFGYVSATDIFVQNPNGNHSDDHAANPNDHKWEDHLAELAKHPLPEATIRRVDEINACWDAVNSSPRFAQLQTRLWLGTTTDEPPTPAQLRDRARAMPADREAAMAWLEETRPCNDWGPGRRAGDTMMLAYIASRRAVIQMLTKGAPYGQVSLYVYAATKSFEQQFRAQAHRPQSGTPDLLDPGG